MSGGAVRINSILVERHTNSEAIARRGAEVVAKTLDEKPDAVLLLPAGSTPVSLFGELRKRHGALELDLSQAQGFQLDEIVGVAPEDTRSFQAFLQKHFFKGLSSSQAQLLTGNATDPAEEIHRHVAELERLGGADLALLGIGSNGHIAFNEPGASLDAPARVVTLAEATRKGMEQHFAEDELPTHGITLGVREIYASARILLIATGASKAKILHDLVRGGVSSDLPASLLSEHSDFLVLCDEEAGKLL